ncbi:MAG TPA: tripartite tricarboxylate transporter substrate binding protein, partial [Burkholderiales bacterium]|nr:tripartite tricarboxylate transporter substrate binding protein [Burkholderiales bacterium]
MPREILMAVALLAAACAHAQQAYPVKPIRIVVPFAPGGIADFAARSVSQRLSESFAVPVIVDNRAGAAGIVGSDIVAKAPADGYTVLITSISHTINLSVNKNLPFDTRRDFTPVALIADAPNMLVTHPSLPVRSVKELIALARARPKEITYASSGSGTSTHLSGELFKALTRTDLTHVPYKSGGPAVTDLLGGHVQAMFATLPSVLHHVKASRLRALAVTSGRRFAGAPQYPTMMEAGVAGYDVSGWTGMFVPSGTPAEVVRRLAAETSKILSGPKTKELFLAQGAEPGTTMLEPFAAFVESEIVKWKKVVEFSG